jgi:adenylate cyclase
MLAADVVDDTHLMGEDEVATLTAHNILRSEMFQPSLESHRGTVIKRMGDGWLVEFANVAAAIAYAITIQEDDIYCDGINVAARMEALSSDIPLTALCRKTNN